MEKNIIPLIKPYIPPRDVLIPELEEILYSGYIAEGEQVKKFEASLSSFIGNQNILSFNSGTSALHTALILAGVKQGDEVISTALTAEPTNMAILHSGAKIVWADIDYNTGNLSPTSVREKITGKTKAIMLVHYSGVPADIDSFLNISEEYNIPVIEDAAHAFGASYKNKLIGNHSPFVAFSFQAIKHITTADGGALACKNSTEYEKGKLVRWFGIDKTIPRSENNIKIVGYKYHMNNVNATIGLVQMRYLNQNLEKYIANGKYYDINLKNIEGLELLKYDEGSEPSYWLYTIKVDRRDQFIKYMGSKGITASMLHMRNDSHEIFGKFRETLEVLDKFYAHFVHIPCGWWIDDEQREYIIDTIKRGW